MDMHPMSRSFKVPAVKASGGQSKCVRSGRPGDRHRCRRNAPGARQPIDWRSWHDPYGQPIDFCVVREIVEGSKAYLKIVGIDGDIVAVFAGLSPKECREHPNRRQPSDALPHNPEMTCLPSRSTSRQQTPTSRMG
jgi:hypothetical protein